MCNNWEEMLNLTKRGNNVHLTHICTTVRKVVELPRCLSKTLRSWVQGKYTLPVCLRSTNRQIPGECHEL